jgi:endonuclease G
MMLTLSGENRRQLRKALTSGFRSYSSLKIFVSDHFDFRLDEIASSTATKIATDDLIDHFEEQGDISELILALNKERANNPDVKKLMVRLQGFMSQKLLLDITETGETDFPFELPATYNDIQLESFLPTAFSYEADLGKLQRGLRLANAVCKIAFSDRASTGTGVLIASDLILTNYHNLSREKVEESQLLEIAKTLLFEFDLVSKEENSFPRSDIFSPTTTDMILASSPPKLLDYVLLRVEPKIKSVEKIKPISIQSPLPSLNPKDEINVLQHPQGNVMQVSLSASGVVQQDVNRGRVWYVNRTQGGSSGSPCFNRDWKMIALHHGSMARGFGSIREGILLSSILPEILAFLE